MPIPRSVLANLESGRRETVSLAEVLVLAAAMNVAPIELICPTGYDQQTETLPGRMLDPLDAMRWFTGELKLELGGDTITLREPTNSERTSVYLTEYHDELIARLRSQEADAARAVADADQAYESAMAAAHQAAEIATVVAHAQAAAADADRLAVLAVSAADAETVSASARTDADRAASEARYRMNAAQEWRHFIREPLRSTRQEMRQRGMLLPALPADIDLGEDDRK